MNIQKNGQLKTSHLVEYHIEPDGSMWEQVFWHNNPADTNNLFKSTEPYTNGVYHNENAWFNFNVCRDITSWEFLVIQAATSNSTPVKYRWTQTKSPWNAVYEDVTPATTTKVSGNGYSTMNYGGFYNFNSSIFFCNANTSKGNWFGVGSFTAYQGGYPSVNGTVVTTGYCAVFVRVNPKAKEYKSAKLFEANNINEV